MAEWLASIMAGYQWAGALPEVAITATGDRSCLARPRAKNAAERSSTWVQVLILGWRLQANTSGVERDPGEITALRTPAITSPSIRASAQSRLSLPESVIFLASCLCSCLYQHLSHQVRVPKKAAFPKICASLRKYQEYLASNTAHMFS